MEELKKSIGLRCTFCHSELFAFPHENYVPLHGSLIVCANCGRENDVTSLIFVVKAKAMDAAFEREDGSHLSGGLWA
jgi:DNA-directed RNA polymerase subunit RPC12/RpoP